MSIIERENPLNLQYRICLVTSAASPLGVIICKTLLKANALVLGIDTQPRDHSLNAGLGTHFQFEECDVNDSGTPEKVVAASKEKFGLDRLDALVNLVEEGREGNLDGIKNLTQRAVGIMKQQGRGSVITILNNAENETECQPLVEFTKDIATEHQDSGIRCTYVLPQASGGGDTESAKAYQDAQKEHMAALMKTESPALKTEVSRPYQVGNLALFLAGDMSEGIAGRAVRLDGSSSPV